MATPMSLLPPTNGNNGNNDQLGPTIGIQCMR